MFLKSGGLGTRYSQIPLNCGKHVIIFEKINLDFLVLLMRHKCARSTKA
jgi:hypothetical protein